MQHEETRDPSQRPSATPEQESGDGATDDGREAMAVDAGRQERSTTGDAAVDEVLATVAALDDRPVDEHVAVFEQAHDRLRRALDAQPDS